MAKRTNIERPSSPAKDGKPIITFSEETGDRDQVWTDIANVIEKRTKASS